jgi:glycerate kinase
LHVVAAPNALKGSLSASAAAAAIAEGVRRAAPDARVSELAVADGGDGTREVLAAALGGTTQALEVQDALGRPIAAHFSVLPDGTAAIDVASASGLAHLKADELDALGASSFGSGQLVRAALDAGCRHVVLGVGGSATVDGGAGLLEALGVRLLDGDGAVVPRGGRGLALARSVDRSAAHPGLSHLKLTVACDVTSSLGEAARLYGPQKGASPAEVAALERNLALYRRLLGLGELARGGAAGGIAAGLHALLGARLVSGIEYVLDVIGFDQAVRDADLVVSAEGHFDATSKSDKGPWGVAARAKRFGVPTVVLAGGVDRDALPSGGPVAAAFSISSGAVDLAASLASSARDLTDTAEQVVRLFSAGRSGLAATARRG